MEKQHNDQFIFTWVLENFSSYYPSENFFFQSPRFAINSLPGRSWSVKLFPRGDTDENYVALHLCREDKVPEDCCIAYRFQFLDCNEMLFFDCNGKIRILAANETCRFSKYIDHNSVLKYLINDILVIKCRLKSVPETNRNEVLPSLWPSNDLFSDIVLRAGARTFKVHKAILEARWPKLMKRLRTKRAREEVFDIDADVLEAILQYVYNGKIDFIKDELLEKVYAAAIKYELSNLKLLPVAQTWQTRVDVDIISFEWSLHNFSSLSLPDVSQITIYPSNNSESDWSVLFEVCKSTSFERVCIVSLYRGNGDKKICVESKVYYDQSNSVEDKHVFETTAERWPCAGFEPSISSDAGDMVPIKCEFKFSIYDPPEIVKSSCASGLPIYCHNFSNDFRDLYESKKLSDTNIHVKSKVFHAHKSILCARSSVFARMFDSGMIESKKNSIEIKDISPDIMDEFLVYIYSGYLKKPLDDRAEHLYIAADKYDVPALKEMCSAFLKSNLSEKNLCKILQLADRHCDEDLYNSILQFSALNAYTVFSTNEWKDLAERNVWIKLLRDVAIRNNPTKRLFGQVRNSEMIRLSFT